MSELVFVFIAVFVGNVAFLPSLHCEDCRPFELFGISHFQQTTVKLLNNEFFDIRSFVRVIH